MLTHYPLSCIPGYGTYRRITNLDLLWISGSWTHQITIGADELPPGGDYYTFYAPIY